MVLPLLFSSYSLDIPNPIHVTKVGNESIGISDGSFVFDDGRPDGSLKQQAAQAIQSNNTTTATSYLNQAVGMDSSDAEAHIYLEDLRILNSGSPYITLVVGTMLSG